MWEVDTTPLSCACESMTGEPIVRINEDDHLSPSASRGCGRSRVSSSSDSSSGSSRSDNSSGSSYSSRTNSSTHVYEVEVVHKYV